MSKELEALKLDLEEFKLSKNAEFILLRFDREEALNMLKALTPPTADEVCESLSEFMGEEIIYESTSFFNKGRYAEVCALGNLNGVYFSTHLPPQLITLIGKFYEGLEK